jgi:PAS domain-containing protein
VPTPPILARYGVAAGTVLLALALRWSIHDLVRERMPFVFFSAAIAVSAWYGQWRAGLFATLLSAFIVKLLLIEPTGLLTWTTGSIIAVSGYVGTGLIIVGALQATHAANGRLRVRLAERIEAEEALRHTERGLRERVEELDTLMNILPVGVWVGNRDCSEITGNPAAYRIMGLPQGVNASVTTDKPEMPTGLRIFVDGKEVTPQDAPMQQVARTAKPWQNFEHEVRFPDGTAKMVYGSVAPLFDEHGRVRKVIGAYADFTDRREMTNGRDGWPLS